MTMPFQPQPCAGDDPIEIPEPCCSPAIATTGLCLGDGTPIAVLAVSACAECGGPAAAPAVSGWINLLTGAFTAGSPPAGTEACLNQPQQFQVGQWCDLDGAGEVIAPVLVEYEYDDQGQLVGVRTLTPAGDPYAVVGTLGLCPQAVGEPQYVEMCDVQPDGSIVRFLRGYTPNGDGTANPDDIDVDGNTYTPTGTVGACEPCASSVQTTRLCDLNPDVEPDDQGRRCATPFLRHMVYDCAGELVATHDTEIDGVTPYTPVQVVDCQCGAGGSVPSLVELVWPQTDVIADPDGTAGNDFIYLLTNPQTGETAEVRLNTLTAPAANCGVWTPGNNVSVNAPNGNPSANSRFTFTLDAAAQQMTTFRLDFIDLDTFEGVRGLTPPPDRVEFSVGAGTWTPGSGNISATVANSTAHAYWDNPPPSITHLYANNGGGTACHAAALEGLTLIPGDCCGGSEQMLAPVEFCFSTTETVQRPGRAYEADLLIAQGFGIEAILVDLIEFPAPVIWGVNDPNGSQFASDLRAATLARFPGATVTVTPPAIATTCGEPEVFHVRIECLDLEDNPPALVQYRYNAGRDLVSNPSFLTTPPVPNAGPTQLKRADGPGPLNTLNCTNVANRGWETNDTNQSFEYWGYANDPPGISALNASKQTTPTPRGTPVQEINAFGSGGGNPSTIWQTFQVTAAGNFNIRVVVGGRTQPVENIAIKLSTGDVDASGTGDIINTVVAAPRVTNEGGGIPGPWTTYTNTVPLAPGLYTLAFTGPTGTGGATGGLFTDMRVYQDLPNQLANFTTDDDECTVDVDVTSTTCELWSPVTLGGEIVRWHRLADGTVLDNAAFWGQVPAPSCCTPGTAGGSSTAGNLLDSYQVCATVGGERMTVQRVVITTQAGGVIAEQYIGPNGLPVTPSEWTPGACATAAEPAEPGVDVETFPLCVLDNATGNIIQNIRAEVVYDAEGTATTIRYVDAVTGGPVAMPGGTHLGVCPGASSECRDSAVVLLCDVPSDTTQIITPGIADSDVAAIAQTQFQDHPGPYTALWTGGTFVYPAGPGPVQEHLAATGQITADMTGCENATGTLTISVRIRNDGPDSGQAWDGSLRLFRGTTMIAAHDALTWAPPGWEGVRTVSVPVTAADMTSGDIRVSLILETYHLGAKQWTASDFSAVLEMDGCDATVAKQILANVVTDCETGETVSVSYTELDGTPYTPTGEVGQCQPASTTECCPEGATVVLCDVDGTGTATPFIRRFTYTPGNATPSVTSFELDGVTPYEPQGTVGVCPGAAATADGPVEVLVECRCDDVAGDGSDIFRFVELIAVAADGTLTSLGYWTEDLSSPYDPVSPIPCPGAGAPPAMPNPGLVSTVASHDGAGAGSTNVPAGARSITLTVHEGSVTVLIGAGPAQDVPVGSYTWAVDAGGPGGEHLADVFAFSGGVGAVWTVHTTREV